MGSLTNCFQKHKEKALGNESLLIVAAMQYRSHLFRVVPDQTSLVQVEITEGIMRGTQGPLNSVCIVLTAISPLHQLMMAISRLCYCHGRE